MRCVLVLVPLLLLAACTEPAPAEAQRPTGPVPYGWYDNRTGMGDAALLEGEVRDEGGCLVVGDTVVVFPWHRVSADDGGFVFSTGGGRLSLHPGERVSLGGGLGSAGPGVVVPEACPPGDVFYVGDN